VFCNTCGADIPNDSRFCSMCGDSFLVSPNRQRKAGQDWSRTVFAIAGVLLLSALGYYLYTNSRIHGAASAIDGLDRSFAKLTKKPHSIPLVNEGLTINQLGYSYFKLQVPSKARSVEFHGNFTASGGAGNMIEAYLFSAEGYEGWQRQQNPSPFYSSGRVSMDRMDAELPSGPGTYYLVFNNKFSLLSPKTIHVEAKLTYYQ
jgi:predicted nucleic acid-binding Zn ribbon protein